MNPAVRKMRLAFLAWAWLLGAMGYMIWGVVTGSGLYQWLVDWQVERWGVYYPKLTGSLPVLVLALPALVFLRRRELELREQGAAAQARRFVRNARLVILGSLLALALAGAALWLSRSVPAGDEPAVPIDLAVLARGDLPDGRVRVRGEIDPAASTGIEESGRPVADRTTFYVGLRAEGEPADAPFRLFVERTAWTPDVAKTTQVFLPDQEGYLDRNGLPPLARRDLEARGVRVAEPHYVLLTGSRALRDRHYMVAGIAGLLGLVMLPVGLISLLQARGRLRRAAVEPA